MPSVYNMSPFGIKVESYLRINGIPYEAVHTLKVGPKGCIPYMTLANKQDNGITDDNASEVKKGKGETEGSEGEEEMIPDSNVILARLRSEFGEGTDAKLTPAQRAVAHAFTRTLEEHTTQIGFYYRYSLHVEEFIDKMEIRERLYSQMSKEEREKKIQGWVKSMPEYISNKIKYRGLGKHTEEELWSFANDDLRAMSDYLGDKEWFFGGNEATTMDCVLFGHITQFLYMPLDFPQKAFLRNKCPNVVGLVERFKSRYWPDWKEKCKMVTPLPMATTQAQ